MTDYASLSDADLLALYKKAKDPFEAALSAEGVTGKAADVARSIYQQESGSGKNTKTSNAGAVGGMQIIPATFKSVADKDWDINDPTQNARAGIRYVKQLFEQAGGDPALTAAGYYGGPGGLEKARRGVAVSDPRNPDAPTTLQYGQQVAARLPKEPMNPIMVAGKAITDAVIPSANAGQPNYGNRPDGTSKGLGFFGELKRPDGNVSTEVSVGVNIGGKEMDIPLLVPTLSKAEVDQVLSMRPDEQPPEALVRKAAEFAKQRLAQGKSVFAGAGEQAPQESPYSKMSDDELMAAYQKMKPAEIPRVEVRGTSADEPSLLGQARGALNASREVATDLGKGFIRGAARMGNTIINSGTKAAADAIPSEPNPLINPEFQRPQQSLSGLITGKKPMSPAEVANLERQGSLAAYDKEAPTSLAYQAGDLTAQIAGTAGVGGALAAPLKAVAPALPLVGNIVGKFGNAIQSGGMTVGGAPATTLVQGAGNLALRAGGGAVSGGASAGLVNPDDAGTGALISGAIPVAAKTAGTVGKVIGRGLSGGGMSDEVKALAIRAKELGIDIPADRLVNSKPLNAVASSLEYVPLSGRTGTMRKMQDQLNRAVTRSFGQDSDNVTLALRKASDDLGAKFDNVLTKTKVNVDEQFMQDLAESANKASRELGSDGAKIISNQVDDILAKAASGQIDGQAAYNIKKTLDQIGRRNSSEAFYALDLKQKLMDALNRSLGPEEAKAFAQTRRQYGNMLSLEKLASNGVEGDLSIARLANMRNINNPELQELADISAQFLKSREGAHGAAQRTVLGTGALLTGGATGTLPAVGAGMAVGRGANMLLNSGAARNALLGQPQTNSLLRFAGEPDLAQMFYRAAPVVGTNGP